MDERPAIRAGTTTGPADPPKPAVQVSIAERTLDRPPLAFVAARFARRSHFRLPNDTTPAIARGTAQ